MPNDRAVAVPLAELPPHSMKEVEVGDLDILLVRHGDTVTAIEATCPHAGGKLAEGVLDGDRVICPWHKAAFCVRAGTCLEPPAVDDLRSFPVEVRDGQVLVTAASQAGAVAPRRATGGSDRRIFAILGSGAAGVAAAQTLRAEGFGGRVVMIDREGTLPYDRTVLSKYTLSGTEAGEKSPLHSEDFYRREAIERLTAEVVELDAQAKRIAFTHGSPLTYDAALLATGGIPVDPPFPGADRANVFALRSQADAARIVAAAERARRAVVIGGGFIGIEAAGSLRERGLEVTVVANEKAPFEKQLGAAVGSVFQALHEEKGVVFRLGRTVARLEGDQTVRRVVLDDGTTVDTDLVVAGLGIHPATDFLKGVTLRDDGGVPVDAGLRAAEHLYAAGDVPTFPLRGDGPPTRIEHWRVAQQHGRVAARNMLGADCPYDAVPYFWTIHYKQRLDYVGHASGDAELVVRGNLETRDFIAYYLRDGRVAAAAGMGRDRDMAAVLALLADPQAWTPDAIHPPGSSPSAVLRLRNGN